MGVGPNSFASDAGARPQRASSTISRLNSGVSRTDLSAIVNASKTNLGVYTNPGQVQLGPYDSTGLFRADAAKGSICVRSRPARQAQLLLCLPLALQIRF